jgi:hypothetical protein
MFRSNETNEVGSLGLKTTNLIGRELLPVSWPGRVRVGFHLRAARLTVTVSARGQRIDAFTETVMVSRGDYR